MKSYRALLKDLKRIEGVRRVVTLHMGLIVAIFSVRMIGKKESPGVFKPARNPHQIIRDMASVCTNPKVCVEITMPSLTYQVRNSKPVLFAYTDECIHVLAYRKAPE